MKKIFLVIIFLFVSFNVFADTHEASDCEEGSINTAIGLASAGDTVSVPAGSCTWTSKVTVNKDIILQGAGIDSTNIDCDTAENSSSECLNINVSSGSNLRLTGFTFLETDATHYVSYGIILITNSPDGYRIDHNEFNGINSRVMQIQSGVGSSGLIDNNEFTNTSELQPTASAIRQYGDPNDWTGTDSLGSGDALYIEDNVFTYDNDIVWVVDLESGAKQVVRYNTGTNYKIAHHGLENTLGSLRHEVYENSVTYTLTASSDTFFEFRGGTSIVFNNTIVDDTLGDGDGTPGEGSELWKVFWTHYYCNTENCSDVSSCHSELEGIEACSSYPCKNQQSRGVNQTLVPTYIWGNTYNGYAYNDPDATENTNIGDCAEPEEWVTMASMFQENTDYYLTEDISFTPYTYPHPLQGVGVVLTGTVTSDFNENDVVTGGRTIILTTTGTTWDADICTTHLATLRNGVVSAQNETNGWNNEAQDNLTCVRDSDYQITLTDAPSASYNITINDGPITTTIGAALTASGVEIVASSTFTVGVITETSSVKSGGYNANGKSGGYNANAKSIGYH